MARLMFFIKEVAIDSHYASSIRCCARRCNVSLDRGVDCILKCQIKVDGKLTAWCAQHDEKDFSPQPAPTFEPHSLSGSESIGVVHALMTVENPTPE